MSSIPSPCVTCGLSNADLIIQCEGICGKNFHRSCLPGPKLRKFKSYTCDECMEIKPCHILKAYSILITSHQETIELLSKIERKISLFQSAFDTFDSDRDILNKRMDHIFDQLHGIASSTSNINDLSHKLLTTSRSLISTISDININPEVTSLREDLSSTNRLIGALHVRIDSLPSHSSRLVRESWTADRPQSAPLPAVPSPNLLPSSPNPSSAFHPQDASNLNIPGNMVPRNPISPHQHQPPKQALFESSADQTVDAPDHLLPIRPYHSARTPSLHLSTQTSLPSTSASLNPPPDDSVHVSLPGNPQQCITQNNSPTLPSPPPPSSHTTSLISSQITWIHRDKVDYSSLYVSRCHPSTSCDMVKQLFSSSLHIPINNIFCRILIKADKPLNELTFVSFKVSIPSSYLIEALQFSWPHGALVSVFRNKARHTPIHRPMPQAPPSIPKNLVIQPPIVNP